MIPGLKFATSLVQDWLVKAILMGVVGMLGWNAYEMRMARASLELHTGAVRSDMKPMVRVALELDKPDPLSRSGAPMLYRYLDQYDTIQREVGEIKKSVGDVRTGLGIVDSKVDQVLDALRKGKKP